MHSLTPSSSLAVVAVVVRAMDFKISIISSLMLILNHSTRIVQLNPDVLYDVDTLYPCS